MFSSLLGIYLELLSHMVTLSLVFWGIARLYTKAAALFYNHTSSVSQHPHQNFCIWCEVQVQLHSTVCRHLVFTASFVKKAILSLLDCLDILVRNQLTINGWIYFCTLKSMTTKSDKGTKVIHWRKNSFFNKWC